MDADARRLAQRNRALATNWVARSATANTAIRLARQPRPCAWGPALAALADMVEGSATAAGADSVGVPPSVAAIALLCVADSDLPYTRRCDVALRTYARLRAAAA